MALSQPPLLSWSVMERPWETDHYGMLEKDVPRASLVDIRVREERLLFCTHQFQRHHGQLPSVRSGFFIREQIS